MLLTLLKSSACLAFFMLFYKFCLEKVSAHIFKRFYLIAVIFISIGIPFITFTEYIEVNIEPQNIEISALQNNFTANNLDIVETKTIQDNLPQILWIIYSIGVLLFSFRFFKNLYQLIYKIKQNTKYKYQSFINVLIHDLIIPHTFLNYIFVNKSSFEKNVIPQEVLLHEQAHAKQKHSLDILFIETLQILFWFNPLLYFIKKDIKLNHEFLADQYVLNKGIKSSTYQNTLLAFSSNAHSNTLANAINYSLIKKRFTVMKTQTPKTAIWLRTFIILPLLAVLVCGFSKKEIIESNQITKTLLNTKKGVTESAMKEYINFINMYKSSKIIQHNKLRRMAAIYQLMTDKQKATVNKLPDKLLNTFGAFKENVKHPTKVQIDSWKNSTELTIYLDALRIKNTALSNYNPSDIIYYRLSSNKSITDKNIKFIPNRCHLYTSEGYKNIILKYNFNYYHKIFVKYNNEIDSYINSNKIDDSELRILKVQLDNLFSGFSNKEIEEYNPRKAPPIPIKNKIPHSKKQKTSKTVADYNVLAKKYNNLDGNKKRYSSKEVDLLYTLYNSLSSKEKNTAEIFPNLPYPVQKRHEERLLKRNKSIEKNKFEKSI